MVSVLKRGEKGQKFKDSKVQGSRFKSSKFKVQGSKWIVFENDRDIERLNF
jgi:hypothetical protein